MGPVSFSRLLSFPFLSWIFLSASYGQTGPAFCVVSAESPIVRSEGVAERVGDILLDCSGGRPGAVEEGNLSILPSAAVTNRLAANGTLDASLTINTGAGFQPSVAATPYAQGLAFNGIRFTIPATGKVTFRITNIRVNANQLGLSQRPIQALLAFNGLTDLAIQNNSPTIAVSGRGLRASFASRAIRCAGSPLPSTIDLPSLLAKGTFYTPARLTEGFPSAFQARDASATNGTRIVSRYSGFPAGAKLFVPDIVTGSSPQLVAVRVLNTDANGAGGAPITPGTFGADQNSVTEVPLFGGAGVAVYEIVSANPGVQESFSFPTFVGLGPVTEPAVASQQLSLGPLSAEATASSSAPVPRFVPVAPPSDCDRPEECEAQLVISGDALQFSGFAGGTAWNPRYIQIRNGNIAVTDMPWTVSVAYKTGSGWLMFAPQSGINNATVRFDVVMSNLTPGTYEATVTVDAGPQAGIRTLPVVARVSGLPEVPATPKPPETPTTPPPPPITVSSIGNAASPWPGAITPGSLATIKGTHFAGKSVAVTFDGLAATLLYTSESQLNLLVPAELGLKAKSQMVITVDGVSSAAQQVDLAPVAPAIFAGGILNENGTPNDVSSPARVGGFIAFWSTGLIPVAGQSTVTVTIHDRERLIPAYAGAAPGLPGVQQVNVLIPEDLPTMTTEVKVCGTSASGQQVCSLPLKLTIAR